jgi:MoaA/NifB/PqqE/SkfB family radical SAM enzyme
MFFSEITQIEINPTELCNLACSFCPRSTFYPNLNEYMSLDVAREIRDQMIAARFSGALSITGRGEPTLHPQFVEYVSIFVGYGWKLKMHTNGKRFEKYKEFILKAFNEVHYNCYEHSESEVAEIYNKFKPYNNMLINYKKIEKTWNKIEGLTNRAGSFPTNEMPADTRCDILFHKMFIDIDGTYRLCCEDWKEKVSLGNIFKINIVDYIEDDPLLKSYRDNLIKGIRDKLPCTNCTYCISSNKYNKTDIDIKKYEKLVWMNNV